MVKPLSLYLHCGANHVTREEVLGAKTPDPTDTHFPIPHGTLIRLMEDKLPDYGLEIKQEAHGMREDGSNYFGMFQVAGGDGASLNSDFSLVIGLRNSHIKKFAAGLCCGAGVFVCDNLSFSGEAEIGRKHTRYIMNDLPLRMSNCMARLMNARNTQEERIAAYKQYEVSNKEADHLVCEAYRADAIKKTNIADVLEQWRTPAHPEFKDRNAWSLFNGFTEVYKGANSASKALGVNATMNRSRRLHGVLDAACGLLTDKERVLEGVIDVEATTVKVS